MKRKSKSHRQGQPRFRSLIGIISHYKLFKPFKADDARSIFITATSSESGWTKCTTEEFLEYLETL